MCANGVPFLCEQTQQNVEKYATTVCSYLQQLLMQKNSHTSLPYNFCMHDILRNFWIIEGYLHLKEAIDQIKQALLILIYAFLFRDCDFSLGWILRSQSHNHLILSGVFIWVAGFTLCDTSLNLLLINNLFVYCITSNLFESCSVENRYKGFVSQI